MKIQETKEIKAYLKRLKENLNNNFQNDYLDGFIDSSIEKEAKKELLEAGQQELEDKSISLFLSAKEWNNNPYVKNIRFDNVKLQHFSYEKVLIEKGYLFNADAIIDDKEKELKDYMKLRALDEDIEALFLYQDKKEWMMSVPSEALTNDPYAKKAHGKVITFGLGIGYFTYMALLNKKVESITVIEKSKEVIQLFHQIKNQFPQNDKITILQKDAFDCFNKEFLKDYDYIYVDIWQSSKDGREIIEKLLELYNPSLLSLDFWIEKSCTNVIRTLIYMVYDEIVNHKTNKTSKQYQRLMNKVRYYFNHLDKEISNSNELKEIMYDQKVIRDILSIPYQRVLKEMKK